MISVEQAWDILNQNLFQPKIEKVALRDSSGFFLATDIFSNHDHPFFDNSAVDGYALRFADLESGIGKLKVLGKIPAGGSGDRLDLGNAARIFTGAELPMGADTVIMQEFVVLEKDEIQLRDSGLRQGSNVRKKGEQIISGQLILEKGTRISPPLIGFLASVGIHQIPVFRFPKVHIIVTGDEFVEPGSELSPGKIFESNCAMLQAAFASIGVSAITEIVKDSEAGIAEAINTQSENNDLVILTGGVSVGEYDFTRAALEANAYSVCFHKVSQKPGKPLLFARKKNQFAFGLPGNPRAVMMAFYLHILHWMHLSFNSSKPGLEIISLPIAHPYFKKGDRAEFLTCRAEDGKILVNEKQGSHMLSSFSDAFGIAFIPQSASKLEMGDSVRVYILPK